MMMSDDGVMRDCEWGSFCFMWPCPPIIVCSSIVPQKKKKKIVEKTGKKKKKRGKRGPEVAVDLGLLACFFILFPPF